MERVKREMPIQMDRVMELTGYSKSYIYQLVHYGKIPFHKPSGKLFFLESEIIEFLTRNRKAADYEIAEQADAILNGEVPQSEKRLRLVRRAV